MADTEGFKIFIGLFIGTLALVGMALAIIAFVLMYQRKAIAHKLEIKTKDEAMQKELLRAAIQSQEEEQRRIARDLHDDLGPMLSAVKLKISQLARRYNGDATAVPELADSKQMLDVTIQQVRGISHRLLPPLLEEYGLATAIESSCEKLSSPNLQIQLIMQQNYQRMPTDTELALYRVIMELLNNVVKHSGATQASVTISQSNSHLYQIKVCDNGVGFNANQLNPHAGLGLKNISSRLSAINATIQYQSTTGNTSITITPATIR